MHTRTHTGRSTYTHAFRHTHACTRTYKYTPREKHMHTHIIHNTCYANTSLSVSESFPALWQADYGRMNWLIYIFISTWEDLQPDCLANQPVTGPCQPTKNIVWFVLRRTNKIKFLACQLLDRPDNKFCLSDKRRTDQIIILACRTWTWIPHLELVGLPHLLCETT